jgi:hypothetical protein
MTQTLSINDDKAMKGKPMNFIFSISWKERLVLAVAFGALSLSVTSLIMFDSLFGRPTIDPEDVVGSVVSTKGRVERRTPDIFTFSKLYSRDSIGNGDTIFSGATSNSSIKLTDESLIRIGENSLVVIRMMDGKFNIRIDKGSVSGKLNRDSQIELQTEEESVYLNGENQTEFNFRYVPRRGLQTKNRQMIGDASENKKVKDAKKKAKKKKQVQSVKENQKDKKTAQVEPAPDTVVEQVQYIPNSSKEKLQMMKKKMKDKRYTSSLKAHRRTLKMQPPYPKNKQMLLYKKAKNLSLLPIEGCQTLCRYRITKDNKILRQGEFEPDRVPVLDLDIAEIGDGQITWEIEDGAVKHQGSFEVYPFSESRFGQALKSQKDIEVLE